MPILPPERTAAMQAIAERGFIPDRQSFAARIVAADKARRDAVAICEEHIRAIEIRIAHAKDALKAGHVGSARTYLEIGQRDYTAAINSLPKV